MIAGAAHASISPIRNPSTTIVARHAGEMINELWRWSQGSVCVPCPRHPRLSDPDRSDQESDGRLQPHAFDADPRSLLQRWLKW
jgi:hypothetical protein